MFIVQEIFAVICIILLIDILQLWFLGLVILIYLFIKSLIKNNNMKKVFYFDVETTGLDPVKHDIIQLAGYIEIDGEIKEEFNFKYRPLDFDTINPGALEINGVTIEQLKEYPHADATRTQLVTIFNKYIDKFNKEDKFIVAGYNVQFDISFLSSFFKKCGDNFLFSYLDGRAILDPYPVLQFLKANKIINIPTLKLTDVCKHFGIGFVNAHDALADIEATKKLSEFIISEFLIDTETLRAAYGK